MITEWNVTIAGCVLCLVFSWFLGVVSRSQGVRFGMIGPIVGIVGTFVLAGLAVSGPLHNPSPEFERGVVLMHTHTIKTDLHTVEGDLANLIRRSLVVRTMREAGRRPSRNHLPWEYSHGKLEWVTKEEYKKLRRMK